MRTDPVDLDDRIHTLLGRAVAESPQAPDAVHVARRGAQLVADPTHHRGRSRRALVVAIAAAVLLVGGIVAHRQHDGDRTVVTTPPGGRVRYVLGDGAEGYALASWRDRSAGDDAALDEHDTRTVPMQVAVFRRVVDGTVVRVALPYSGQGAIDHGSDQEPDDDTWLRRRVGAEEVDAERLELAGAPAVRAGHLGIGDDVRATSFFLRQGDQLVEVDVYGLGDDEAFDAVAGFVVRSGGGLTPPEDGTFELLDDLPTDPRSGLAAPSTSVGYEGPGGRQASVTSIGLRSGGDEVLTNIWGLGLGTLERWGDRDVLVHLWRGSPSATATFAESGRLVIVEAEVEVLPDLVAGLVPADDARWASIVEEETARIRALGTSDAVDVGAGRIDVHRAIGADRPAGWCLTVDGSTACATEQFPPDGRTGRADTGGRAFDVLIDGHWWAFGRGDTRGPNDEEGASGPLEFPGRVDAVSATNPIQVEVDDVWWWTWRLPDDATALYVDVLRPPDGSGIGHEATRPAS